METTEIPAVAAKKQQKHIHLDDINLKTNQITFVQNGHEGKRLIVSINDELFAETTIVDPLVIVTSTEKKIPSSHTISFKLV